MQPFSATVTLSGADQAFGGVFRYESPQNMQLLFQSPAELIGLCAELKNGKSVLRLGETALQMQQAALLFGKDAAPSAFFAAMASLGALPLELNREFSAHLITENGRIFALFNRDSMQLQTLETDAVSVRFLHTSRLDA